MQQCIGKKYHESETVSQFLPAPHGFWDLSSLIRNQTQVLGSETPIPTTGPPGNSLGIVSIIPDLSQKANK